MSVVYVCLSAWLIILHRVWAVVQSYILASRERPLWSRLRLLVLLSCWSAARLSYRKSCRKNRGSKAAWKVPEEDFFLYHVGLKQKWFHFLSSWKTQPSAQGQVRRGWASICNNRLNVESEIMILKTLYRVDLICCYMGKEFTLERWAPAGSPQVHPFESDSKTNS